MIYRTRSTGHALVGLALQHGEQVGKSLLIKAAPVSDDLGRGHRAGEVAGAGGVQALAGEGDSVLLLLSECHACIVAWMNKPTRWPPGRLTRARIAATSSASTPWKCRW